MTEEVDSSHKLYIRRNFSKDIPGNSWWPCKKLPPTEGKPVAKMCIIEVTFLQLDFDLYSMALMLGVDLDILKMYRVHAYLKTKMAFKTRPPWLHSSLCLRHVRGLSRAIK